jgi:glycosyltransferase involved in cell wall biosynthesis
LTNRKIRVAHLITGIGTGGAGEDTLCTIEGLDKEKYHINLVMAKELREGLPRVLVQAAAVGIPIVAFNIDGVSEILKDNYNGFLVEPTNIKQLVERIIKYMNNKELIRIHGKNGQNVVKNRWSVKGMVRRTDQIYNHLVEKKLIIK